MFLVTKYKLNAERIKRWNIVKTIKTDCVIASVWFFVGHKSPNFGKTKIVHLQWIIWVMLQYKENKAYLPFIEAKPGIYDSKIIGCMANLLAFADCLRIRQSNQFGVAAIFN